MAQEFDPKLWKLSNNTSQQNLQNPNKTNKPPNNPWPSISKEPTHLPPFNHNNRYRKLPHTHFRPNTTPCRYTKYHFSIRKNRICIQLQLLLDPYKHLTQKWQQQQMNSPAQNMITLQQSAKNTQTSSYNAYPKPYNNQSPKHQILKDGTVYMNQQNSDQHPRRILWKFWGHLTFEEFNSHLNCWMLRLSTRTLIKIFEEYHNNFVVIQFLKRILIKSLMYFTKISWSSISSRAQKLFEWLDTKAGHQNSDQNS